MPRAASPRPPAAGSPLGTGQATGKLILAGEHAVVYGHGALAVPTPGVTASATLWPSQGRAALTVTHLAPAEDHPARIEPGDSSMLATALRAALQAAQALSGRGLPPHGVEISLDIPLGRGMGSSAAMAVAAVRAAAMALDMDWDAATIAQLALAAERVTHGNPSGIDTRVIAEGQPLWFCRGQGEAVTVGRSVPLLIADSGSAGSTKAMVSAVRAARDANPERYDLLFTQMGRLATAARAALEAGDLAALGQAFVANHALLREIGVSTPVLDGLVDAALGAGALGAKLSGGGGGGVVLALVEEDRRAAVLAALRAAGAARTLESTVTSSDPASVATSVPGDPRASTLTGPAPC